MGTPSFEMNRRGFLVRTGLAASGIGMGLPRAWTAEAARSPADRERVRLEDLPVGGAPAPLSLPHFPSRVHAFVWRNWPLVPVQRMAEVLGTTAREVRRLGRLMGLGRAPRIGNEQRRRSYITIIKRNWHLLPYEQLLTLLGWGADELAFTLREDDFLWIKLGSLKPHCPPVRWADDALSGAERETAAAQVARVMQKELGGGFEGRWGQMFGFVRELTEVPAESGRRLPGADADTRFCYSYFALYGDPLLEPELDPYPDGYLARLAEVGVTGVWLQGVLYKLAPFPWQPDLSEGHTQRLKNLGRLVTRARAHGIAVFLYLNEPRAMPLTFFEGREELKGVTEGDYATLCSSQPAVQEYLAAAVEGICRAAPDLGGFFTITASENLTSCWSHGNGRACRRCADRGPGEVIAEVNSRIKAGIDRAGGAQRLIAWDWGWDDRWAPEVIARLPSDVCLMSVSEWSLPLRRGGIDSVVGEYSLSAVGPGPRAVRHWELARRRGMKTFAKIQANNTWELSALPYLPVAANVAEHASRLRGLGLDGIMLGWTLGGYPSPNLEAVATVMGGGGLEDVALRRFGPVLAKAVRQAWADSADAFREFPYHIGVVYNAPLQCGPANLLWAEPTGYAATMVGFAYDHLDAWRGPYPASVFVDQLARVASGFRRAGEALSGAVEQAVGASAAHRQAVLAEAALARAAAIHFRSVSNQARFVELRGKLGEVATASGRQAVLGEIEPVLRDELRLARELYALQRGDACIGFEASNQYFYLPVDLAEKILNCRHLLDHWLPRQREK